MRDGHSLLVAPPQPGAAPPVRMTHGDSDTVARAYDAVAPTYDELLVKNPVATWMRARLWAHFGAVFPPHARILDITAGTGVDACFLAARGFHVTALDASPGMIAELQKAAARQSMSIDARVLPAERLSELEAREFDGVISTFGGLNTIVDMPRLARDLHQCVKPAAKVIFHALNSFCFWERAAALVRKPRRARNADILIGEHVVHHRFYNPFALWREAFAAYFVPRRVYALSVVAAPALVHRFPRAAPALFALDRVAGRAFPASGDFFVMELESKNYLS
jgi:2-polyprenyl-3-methyl-5-hydroxy-6-metoxy-1,4-benzoquinol methylase